MKSKAFKYSLRLEIDIILPPQEREKILDIPIEKELASNGKILLSVPKYHRDHNGQFIYEPVSLNIVVNDLPKGIDQLVHVLKHLNLLSKAVLQFDTDHYNLLFINNENE